MTDGESLDHSPLRFGKFKGQTPSDISEDHPDYIVWMYQNVKDHPTCSEALYRDCVQDMEDQSREEYEACYE